MELLFKTYLNGKVDCADDYIRYIKSPAFNILGKTFWDFIESLMKNGFSVHALSLCNQQIQDLESQIKKKPKNDPSRGTYQSYKTAFIWLRRFLEYHFTLLKFKNPTSSITLPSNLDLKIDGMELFLNRDSEITIKKAIESIIFFSPDIVIDRHKLLIQKFKNYSNKTLPNRSNESIIPARKTKRKDINIGNGIYSIDGQSYHVQINHDGNKPVRDIIKNETGYVVANGEKSILFHYVISHIWGEAIDPRYFTSMWNIALLPTWLNPVMDKKTTQGPLATSIKETVRAICSNLYFKKRFNIQFSEINLSMPSFKNDKKKNGEYDVLILDKIKNGETYGRFYRKTITIR